MKSNPPRAVDIAGHLAARGLAPKSVRCYAAELWRIEQWCNAHGWTLNNIPAAALTEYLSTRPNSWSTRKLIRHSLLHYWAISGRKKPPDWALRVPRKPRMVCLALEPELARVIAKAARARGDAPGLCILLALYVGLRREEISRVRWDDLTGDGWLRIMGKGDQPAKLPLHPAVIHALERYPRGDSPWLFPGQKPNHPVTPTTVWGWVRDACGYPPHILRHTCLATANDNTGDLRAVQELARHARPETTAGYTRVTARRLLAAVNSLDY